MAENTNSYDNENFFKQYKKLRESPDNTNNIEERPALMSLCPDLIGKSIIDLGCGYGGNCTLFAEMGATHVLGIDVSVKMLEIAAYENPSENISYKNLNINDIDTLTEKFDVVFSSLALHYIDNFDVVLKKINSILNKNGVLIFSQEHPLSTAPKNGSSWTKDENGERIHYNLADYRCDGKREIDWFVAGIVKYHRCFSTIFNSIIDAGFTVEKILEPIASKETLERLPHLKKEMIKPNYLIIRAKKI